jgi:gas vesicle protein
MDSKLQRQLEKLRNQYIIDKLQLKFDEQLLGKVFLPEKWLDHKIYGNERQRLLHKLSKKFITVIPEIIVNENERNRVIYLNLLKRPTIRKEIGELIEAEHAEHKRRIISQQRRIISQQKEAKVASMTPEQDVEWDRKIRKNREDDKAERERVRNMTPEEQVEWASNLWLKK